MMSKNFFPILTPPPSCMGTGLVVLDIIYDDKSDTPPELHAGGSCGNVLTILSYLGWKSYPVARLGKDAASEKIIEDMQCLDVSIDFLETDTRVDTPIIIERISKSINGKPTHRFFFTCPNCGTWLPRYRPILVSTAKNISSKGLNFQSFYFDRATPGTIELAVNARKNGVLVVFEPPNNKDKTFFKKALDACHILKYAHDRICDLDEIIIDNYPKLIVETLGSEGLRYKFLKSPTSPNTWKTLSPFFVEDFKDAAGSGDWCSAGIINSIGRNGVEYFSRITEQEIIEALQFGQAMAALNCRFEGARGSMYKMEKSAFIESVKNILESGEAIEPIVDSFTKEASVLMSRFCPECMPIGASSEKFFVKHP